MESLTPLWLLKYLPNMLACHVSIIHDTQGPSNTITCGQASAGLALQEAARTILRGNADVALIGGCESKVHPMGLMRWSKLDRLTTRHNDDPQNACRPMDMEASGSVIAEGGAVLVIESLEHAQARGAKILAEVAGFGSTATGVGIRETEPTGAAMAAAMNKALRDARIDAQRIDMVVPPGFGMAATDKAEAAAIHAVFGQRPVPVAPLRGGIGDCGAGVQALDLAGAALALRDQVIPPAVNCPHPIAGLNVPQGKLSGPVEAVMVLASALGGQNSAVVLKRFV
jgi:3-oxoacyl-[acyl-carrier-protein] synthase II